MFIHVVKRCIFTKFSKTDIFETLIPFKSSQYFQKLLNEKQTFYLGFDPTAKSLQLGNLFPLISLLRIWRSGHNVIALIGGATGQIGDPTDRVSDREVLPGLVVNSFSNSITKDIEKIVGNFQSHFVTNEQLGSFKLLNNRDWYNQMNILTFITEIMKHFRFHDIKNKRSFESRMKSKNTMNMSEFLYPFLQAYDWLHLYRNFNCKIQIGGDDQIGNMQFGQILVKEIEKATVYGLSVPLFLVGGEKLGKSNDNANMKLWLNSDAQSPYSLYYSLMHVPNSVITNGRLLHRLTLLSDYQIGEIISKFQKNPNKQFLQSILSDEILKLVHGPGILDAVKLTYDLFSTHTPELIQQRLLPINESKVVLDNLNSVPHISIESTADQSITMNQLIQAASVDIDNNSITNIKFNGEIMNNLSLPLNRSIVTKRICGVLQIGSSNKWIVHMKQ